MPAAVPAVLVCAWEISEAANVRQSDAAAVRKQDVTAMVLKSFLLEIEVTRGAQRDSPTVRDLFPNFDVRKRKQPYPTCALPDMNLSKCSARQAHALQPTKVLIFPVRANRTSARAWVRRW